MNNTYHIDRLVTGYTLQTVCLVAVAAILVVGAKAIGLFDTEITAPLVVALVFALTVEVTDIMLWKWVARCHRDSLPTFFTAVSGFRLLLAVFTMVGCWAVVGREAMAPYCLVFMVFYLVVVAHHSLFFVRVSNSKVKSNDDTTPADGNGYASESDNGNGKSSR